MNHKPTHYLLWILGAAILGFGVAVVFGGILRLPRSVFLLPYAVLTGAYIYAYTVWAGVDVRREPRRLWLWGLIGGVLIGAFVVNNVLSQPASPHSRGARLVFDLLWLGFVYGALDAMLLSVLPVHAVWRAFSTSRLSKRWWGRVAVGIVAVVASLFVTTTYHIGYPELRNSSVVFPIIGNGSMTVAYLATSNPLTPGLSHVAMHVTAVLHGPDTTSQLPPHN